MSSPWSVCVKLLTTVGKDLESKDQNLSDWFRKMKDLSQKRDIISNKTRFMIQDVTDL
ncbi:hypothetical protein L798_15514 [Zootermopsis nevadensis]|uniref:Uncharacterized protein n=1 Tax=Zootermopsis nevadensis TaxID=136037 RepID=A0A067QZA1_ZOONE|nr:hypothetical protein L798_15514 [Zootermopsis nevadensis]